MEFNILCDADWEVRIGKVRDKINQLGYQKYFANKKYGSSLDGICLGFICHTKDLKLKRRIRLSNSDKTLYIDVMLDFDKFKAITPSERNEIALKKIIEEIPPIVSKYKPKLKDFDVEKFLIDFKKCFDKKLEPDV